MQRRQHLSLFVTPELCELREGLKACIELYIYKGSLVFDKVCGLKTRSRGSSRPIDAA